MHPEGVGGKGSHDFGRALGTITTRIGDASEFERVLTEERIYVRAGRHRVGHHAAGPTVRLAGARAEVPLVRRSPRTGAGGWAPHRR
ncbi:hypothetical protein CIB93_03880 [Streptomyces sp. WZ.A104]|nr:hypothetical protein CIB93_03880 [Streptomyces sp. WZ.A104]